MIMILVFLLQGKCFEVYIRQDTPPAQDVEWSMPPALPGRKNRPIPPQFEPLLHIQPNTPPAQSLSHLKVSELEDTAKAARCEKTQPELTIIPSCTIDVS
jgi:hypothetical protein